MLCPLLPQLSWFVYAAPFEVPQNLSAVLMTWWETGLISYFESTNLIMQLFTGFVAITFILSIRPIARTFYTQITDSKEWYGSLFPCLYVPYFCVLLIYSFTTVHLEL